MSRALAIATAILTILQSYVSAQAPTCLSGYTWSFNSLGQSPCTMTVALGGVCVNGAFTLAPLQPDFVYLGPTQLTQNSCRCSTVYYSLLSACAYCQAQSFLDWSIYNANCSTVYKEIFPNPIPPATSIPHYAYLDVVAANTFNVTAAMSAGGPESSPVPQATSSTIPATSTSTSTSVAATSKKLNVGAIAGGVVGGVAFVGIAAGLIAFIILRRRKPSASTPSTYPTYTYGSPETDMKYNSTVPTMASGKVYDPNDPTTFPAFPPDAAGYSTYSGSPQRIVTPTITGGTLVGHGTATQKHGAQTQYNTQYTGAPEL